MPSAPIMGEANACDESFPGHLRRGVEAVVDLGDHPDTGKRRQRRKRGFSTQSEAAAALDEAKRAIEAGGHLFEQALAEAVPLEHHLIDQIVCQYNLEEPEAMVRAIRDAGAVIAPIVNPDDRARASAHLADRIGGSEVLIQKALALDPGRRSRPPAIRGRSLA